ncbi:hypothetical protein [Spiroplasma endosymbiont of Nebria brevicollis]|uniref:hypothetical protein n=1 Tax=Spiroplasma endosymbiont of Nebria brevicollis TaxID=3066284 RepID=UPI00313D3E66
MPWYGYLISELLNLNKTKPDMKEWQSVIKKLETMNHEVTIGIIAKYALACCLAQRHKGRV